MSKMWFRCRDKVKVTEEAFMIKGWYDRYSDKYDLDKLLRLGWTSSTDEFSDGLILNLAHVVCVDPSDRRVNINNTALFLSENDWKRLATLIAPDVEG